MKPNLIVYKSSAGSGKTFTLSTNYIAICLTNKSKDYLKKFSQLHLLTRQQMK